jgi:hypothetical protein
VRDNSATATGPASRQQRGTPPGHARVRPSRGWSPKDRIRSMRAADSAVPGSNPRLPNLSNSFIGSYTLPEAGANISAPCSSATRVQMGSYSPAESALVFQTGCWRVFMESFKSLRCRRARLSTCRRKHAGDGALRLRRPSSRVATGLTRACDGLLPQSVFLGLRTDKEAKDVVANRREIDPPEAKHFEHAIRTFNNSGIGLESRQS